MVYLFENFIKYTYLIDEWGALLSDSRRNKVKKYRFDKDKLLCTVSFVLLRYALRCEYNISFVPEFDISQSGKPELKNSNIFFNISHCDNAVLCGIDVNPIGVDIQDYRPDITDVGHIFVGEHETTAFQGANSLTRLWTLKEAYGKFIGEGICYDLKKMDFSGIKNINETQEYNGLKIFSEEFEHYALSVCGENDISIKIAEMTELMEFTNE